MRFLTKFLFTFITLLILTTEGVCAPATALKLCLNSTSGVLTSRARCAAKETALSLATLTTKVTEQQGGLGSEFSVNLSDGAASDVTIPAATNPPVVGPVPGTKSLTATCSTGIVYARSCESADLTSLSLSSGLAADGKSATCTWSNSTNQAKVGRYYAKVVCADL